MLKRLNSYRKANPLLSDFIAGSLVIGAALIAAVYYRSIPGSVSIIAGNRATFYATMASIAGSLLGFVITAVSIIAAFGSMPKFTLLRKTTQYAYIFTVYFNAIYWLAASTVLSIVGFVLDRETSPRRWLMMLAAYVFFITACRVWRCVWILQAMTKIVATPIAETQPPNDESGE